jgi:TPR repeat protein
MSSDFYRSFPGVATVIDQAVEDIFRTPQSLTAVTDAAVDLVRESFPSLSGKDEERLYSTVADEVARRRQYLFWDPEPSDATCFDPLSFKFSFPATEDNPSTFSSGSPVFRGAQIGPSYTSQHGIHSTLGKADEALGRGDVFLAERLASPLALNGDTASQRFLTDLYTKTGDLQKAKYWLRVSVSQGAEDCLFNLATIYLQEGNYKAAELALFRLAVKGQVDAQAQLGTVYLQADQFQEAEKWLSRAADAGHEIASENLALAYGKIGLQLVKSGRPAEAVKYYELSARRGSSKAEFNLGELYEDGTGLGGRNSLLAASWYLLAVNNPKGKFSKATWMLGNPGWQLICGQLLRFGAYHHAPNPESAKQYLEAARAQGEPGAARYLEEMVTLDPGYLSPETIIAFIPK